MLIGVLISNYVLTDELVEKWKTHIIGANKKVLLKWKMIEFE